MTSGQAIIEDEVRELLSRRGIDPVAEPGVVLRLVDDVVEEYLDRSVNSGLPLLGDVQSVSRCVLDAVSGFGPLQTYLDDPIVDDYRAVAS